MSLERLGDVQVAWGDLAGARKSYEESLELARELSSKNPGSAEARRDVCVAQLRLALLPKSNMTWKQVAECLQSMKESGILAPSDEPSLAEALRRARSAP